MEKTWEENKMGKEECAYLYKYGGLKYCPKCSFPKDFWHIYELSAIWTKHVYLSKEM